MDSMVYERAPKGWRKLDEGLRLDPLRNVLATDYWHVLQNTHSGTPGMTLAEWELGERAGIWDDNDIERWMDFEWELG